jgi:hypothetical protein
MSEKIESRSQVSDMGVVVVVIERREDYKLKMISFLREQLRISGLPKFGFVDIAPYNTGKPEFTRVYKKWSSVA